MINDVQSIHRIETPAQTGEDRLDVSFADLGLTQETAQGAKPIIVGKEDSTGTHTAPDESVSLDIPNKRLTIAEGSSGLTQGDIYTVALTMPRATVTGTVRTA